MPLVAGFSRKVIWTGFRGSDTSRFSPLNLCVNSCLSPCFAPKFGTDCRSVGERTSCGIYVADVETEFH